MNIINLSKELMREQTRKNRAPAWLLTELAVRKGMELSAKYSVDERLVVTTLYLAHTVFDPIIGGDVQKNHPKLSADFSREYLSDWGVSSAEQEIILNAIEAHHNHIPTKSKIAEIVKNAECFKFVTIEGSLIWLHELGLRQIPLDKAIDIVIQKMNQKKSLLTLDDCKIEAEKNCSEILKMLDSLKKLEAQPL